jgi:hypothetical protein
VSATPSPEARVPLRDTPAAGWGAAVGVIALASPAPAIPGDVANHRTFGFPVTYVTASDVTVDRLLFEEDLSAGDVILDCALELEGRGCGVITSNCGFTLHFQREVAAACKATVCLSSLLQLPLLDALLPDGRSVLVVSASGASLHPVLLAKSGMSPTRRVTVAGLENCPAFKATFLDEDTPLDVGRVRDEVLEVVSTAVAKDSSIAAVLLECADLPPYARAVQQATALPVLDFVTMIEAAVSFRERRAY